MLQLRELYLTSVISRFLASSSGRSRFLRYGMAVLLPVPALLMTHAFTDVSRAPFFSLFSVAVAMSSLYGGFWPGLLTAGESVLMNLLLTPPTWSLHVATPEALIRIVIFALASSAVAVFIGVVGDVHNRVVVQRSELFITLRSIGDGVIATDTNGNVAFMNPAAEEATGWTLAEARQTPVETVFRIVNENTRKTVNNPIREVLESGSAVNLANHTLLIRKDGSEIPIDDSAAPIRDARNRVVGAVLVFRDITRVRVNQAALQRADRIALAGRLASTIAHEMNNPLQALAGLIYLVLYENGLPPEARARIQLAELELRRAIESTRRTLSVYGGEKQWAEVRLRELVDSVLDLYRVTAADRNVEMTNAIPHELAVTVMRTEMRQLVSNLVSNALDAMPEGGTVSVDATAEQEDGTVRLTVSDTGCGIDSTSLEHIFEPFFTTKNSVGVGLGLWLARRIAEEHSGTVSVESTGTGTAFTVVFPAQPGVRDRDRSVAV